MASNQPNQRQSKHLSFALTALVAVASCSSTDDSGGDKDRCTPETDALFCTRLQAECGVLSAADNCGTLRSVACSPGCGAGSQCSNNQCVCVPETDAEICAASGVACGVVEVFDRCGGSRAPNCPSTCNNGRQCQGNGCVCPFDPVTECGRLGAECGEPSPTLCGVATPIFCGACTEGASCGTQSLKCSCGASGYVGDAVTDLDGSSRLDPATDTLINDAPGYDDGGTWRSCTQNVSAELVPQCVSIAGLQEHLLGSTPDGSSLLIHRSVSPASCASLEPWLYDGTYIPQAYLGTSLAAVLGSAGFDLTDGQRMTLTPDGLTIIGLNASGQLIATSRASRASTAWSAASSAWFTTVNAVGTISTVAISQDSTHLFFRVEGPTPRHYEATRASPSAAFSSPRELPGTASGQINDGTVGFITSARDAHTIYATSDFTTFVYTRDLTDAPFTVRNAGAGLPYWYAHPLNGCASIIGTVTASNCLGEEIGVFEHFD